MLAVCRRVMQTHLSVPMEEEWMRQVMRELSSFFLLSVCIR